MPTELQATATATSAAPFHPPAGIWRGESALSRNDSPALRQLVAWHREKMRFPRDRSVVDFFRDHVAQRPSAPALTDGTRHFDYATLDRLSNRVANHLRQQGLNLEEIVALPLDRSCAYVVAALGVLKAGGSYLPLDLNTPDARLRELVKDSGAKFILTEPGELHRFKNLPAPVFALDHDAASLANAPEVFAAVPSDPNRRAYVIYTSGSTGKPKGVEIEHQSLTNLVCVYQQCLGFSAAERVPLIANVAFDASVADLWPCLCAGGTLLVPPPGLLMDVDGIIAWLAANEVTFTFTPTGLGEILLTRPWPTVMKLRYLGVGGDTLHLHPPPGLPFCVVNQYGPTENTVDSLWAIVPPGGDSELPPIGLPIGNVTAYVLDENGQRVEPGEEGELYLGGEQVARGYLNRPDLTRERFLPDPFSGLNGARMYRTGDWVRERSDGLFDFIGRRDHQVQLRGRRVELGEIERALHAHAAVRQACCEPVMDGGTAASVVAHIVSAQDQPRLADVLRSYLAACLPAYMVPSGFIFHAQLPLTPRGKVDRAALRAAVPAQISEFEASLVAGSPERAIAQLWFRLLPHAHKGEIHASINAVGGDSLHAVKLLLGVEKIIGRRLLMSDFMMDPTLPGLFRLALGGSADKGMPLIPLRPEGHRPAVFCLYGVQGDVYHYLELANALGADQPVYGIRSLALDDPANLPQSIEEAGERAIQWIQHVNLKQPPVLVGYSWGGTLAFEIARQWVRIGGAAPLVILVGAAAPRRRTSPLYRVWHLIRWLPAWLKLKAREGRQRTPAQMLRRFFQFFVRDPAEVPAPIPEEDWANHPIAHHLIALEDKYQPAVSPPLELHLIRETKSEVEYFAHPLDPSFTDHLPDLGWSRWAKRRVELHWIEADHVSILRPPDVKQLAEAIRALMDRPGK